MASSSKTNSMQSEEREAGLKRMAIVPWQPSEAPESTETSTAAPERPGWLPEGWTVEVRERTSGKTKGTKDRYYYDPTFQHRFRSKKEVEYFLETGTVRCTPKSKKVKSSNEKPEGSAAKFNFMNRPAKVSWVLSNPSEGSWTPYMDNEEVPESTRRLWAAAMEDICSGAYRFQE